MDWLVLQKTLLVLPFVNTVLFNVRRLLNEPGIKKWKNNKGCLQKQKPILTWFSFINNQNIVFLLQNAVHFSNVTVYVYPDKLLIDCFDHWIIWRHSAYDEEVLQGFRWCYTLNFSVKVRCFKFCQVRVVFFCCVPVFFCDWESVYAFVFDDVKHLSTSSGWCDDLRWLYAQVWYLLVPPPLEIILRCKSKLLTLFVSYYFLAGFFYLWYKLIFPPQKWRSSKIIRP